MTPGPIKTAPKGERVLAFVRDVQQGWQWQVARWCNVDDCWVSEYLIQRVHPTYWLPLPPAPTL